MKENIIKLINQASVQKVALEYFISIYPVAKIKKDLINLFIKINHIVFGVLIFLKSIVKIIIIKIIEIVIKRVVMEVCLSVHVKRKNQIITIKTLSKLS